MSASVRVEREITADPHLVWSMISDVSRMGEWSPETTAGVWARGSTGPAEGARFTGRNRNGRRRWSTACRVTECEPGRRFGFRVTSGPFAVATWRYEIEPSPRGCTVTEEWIDERSGLVRVLGKPVSGVGDRAAHNRAGMEETLGRLAAVAEAHEA